MAPTQACGIPTDYHLSFNFSEAPHQSFQLISTSYGHKPAVANGKLPELLNWLNGGGPAPSWWNQSQMRADANESGMSFNLDDEHYVMRCPLISLNEETEKWESDSSIQPFVDKFMERLKQGESAP